MNAHGQLLAGLREATDRWHTARDHRDIVRSQLHHAIGDAQTAYGGWIRAVRDAMAGDVPRPEVSAAAGVTVARLYQLVR